MNLSRLNSAARHLSVHTARVEENSLEWEKRLKALEAKSPETLQRESKK
jgi:hypothetical protein